MAAFADIVLHYIENGVREWTAEWNYSITQNFLQGGRPTPWKATRRGGKILQRSNRLHSTISVRYERTGETLFTFKATTNVKYGRIHQYGGYIKPKNKKALAIPLTKEAQEKPPGKWPKKGEPGALFLLVKKGKAFLAVNEGKKVKRHFILLKSVYIPGRPYLMIQDGDKKAFDRLMKDATRSAKLDATLLSKLR